MQRYRILKILFAPLICSMLLIINISAISLTSVKINQYNQNEDILKIYFEAKDENGNRILNLTEQNVNLFSGSNKFEITQILPFKITDEKIAYVFLIDISSSVGKSQFAAICEAISIWIDKMERGDKAAVVTFGDKVTVASDFTGDKAKLKQLVTGLTNSDSSTQLYGGLVKAAEMLRISEAGLPDRRSAVIFTDGKNGSTSTYTKNEAVNAVTGSHAPFYAASFTAVSKETGGSLADFGAVMRQSGGDLYEIKSDGTIFEIFDEIYNQISDIYIATAEIPEPLRDGEKRPLRLSVSIEARTIEETIDIKFMLPAPTETTAAAETKETGSSPAETAGESDPGVSPVIFVAIFAVPVSVAVFFTIFFVVKSRNRVPLPPKARPLPAVRPQNNQEPRFAAGFQTSGTGFNFNNTAGPPDKNEKTQPLFSEALFILDIAESNLDKGGPPREYTRTLRGETFVRIGREPGSNDIVINDATVSGQQCIIKADRSGLGIINKSSANKTLLNGKAIENTAYEPMPPFSIIKIGRTELTIRVRK